jgi:hypothetical protein
MQCQLCNTYYSAERAIEKIEIGKDKNGKAKYTILVNRYCKHKDSIVNEEDESCGKFTPCTFLWCKGWESWTTVKECKNRQDQDKYKSCPCSLGVEVLAVIQLKPVVVKKQLVIRKPKKQLVIRRK